MECPKIFVVEDDAAVREAFKLCLESEGYLVEAFADGTKAIERLKKAPEPCLILLDMLMPIMSGEEFMRAFHELPATIVPIPVYLVSATARDTCAKSLGCVGFAKKPIPLGLLLDIVENYCKTLKQHAS